MTSTSVSPGDRFALLRKWKAVFSIFFQDAVAYRASGFIWTITDVVPSITMPLVWAHASNLSAGPINGFTAGGFVLYYLSLLFLNNFITSHIMWDLATEIKEGQFTVMLIRPMSYYQYTFFRNLSWRIVRTCIFLPLFLLLMLAYRNYLADQRVYVDAIFLLSVLLGHLVSFTFVMAMSTLAFFTQEVFSIFEIYYVPLLFLSGQLFPISLLPNWAQSLAKLFPFYFTTGAPTEMLIGKLQGSAKYETLLIQCLWIAIGYIIFRVLWVKALRSYTAVGM